MKISLNRFAWSAAALGLLFALAAFKPTPPDQQPTPTPPSGQSSG
ncbi:hypothetical protein [Dokdonella ginsengisoli]|uniref:Uncharacterized protein n=1 Tax=Dokdonella ginsengisoli TaxID=363846 RepID=A0ABV9QQ28_9GAMM